MKSKIGFLALLTALLLVPSCRSPLTREAREITREHLNNRYIECNDSFYLMRKSYSAADFKFCPGGIKKPRLDYEAWQIKDLTFALKRDRLSQADRANGIEWKGKVQVRCSINRFFDGAEWKSWKDCDNSKSFSIQKKNGSWTLDIPTFNTEFTCADIPEDICADIDD